MFLPIVVFVTYCKSFKAIVNEALVVEVLLGFIIPVARP